MATAAALVEVFETRYPWFTECYRLNADAGGPGRTRGGLGITRLLHVEAGHEIVVSALCGSRLPLGRTWRVQEGTGSRTS